MRQPKDDDEGSTVIAIGIFAAFAMHALLSDPHIRQDIVQGAPGSIGAIADLSFEIAESMAGRVEDLITEAPADAAAPQ